MPDHVLPWPDPDWEHPQASDAPTPSQVRAIGDIRELSQTLPVWLAAAALGHLQPRHWRELARALITALAIVAEQDNDSISLYTPPTITVLAHQGVRDIDDRSCSRCGLPLGHEVHTPARHRLEGRPQRTDPSGGDAA